MCTNGSGTNSVNPPVSFWRARVRNMWRAQCRGRSTWPNMMVMLDRRPIEWALQVVAQRLVQAPGALVDLQGGEAVDVHAGDRVVDGAGDLDVVVAVEARVDAALQGDLGGAERVGLHHPGCHLVQPEQVGSPAQV